MTAPTTNTPLLDRMAACQPRPQPTARRIPEWLHRMQLGQLKAKDLTGSVAL